MYEVRWTRGFQFVATAEVQGADGVRSARVNLSIAGAYLAMPNPFPKGASTRIKIRTQREFFQADATVANSTCGVGMGVMFHAVSPPFLLVLQEWLIAVVLAGRLQAEEGFPVT
jgi:hypothetical protein